MLKRLTQRLPVSGYHKVSGLLLILVSFMFFARKCLGNENAQLLF